MQKIDMANDAQIAHGVYATLSGVTPAKGNIAKVDKFSGATFAYTTGTVTDAGTASGFAVEIQESATTADGDFTAVADADLTRVETGLTVTADTDDSVAVGLIGYKGSKAYVRAVFTGTTGTDAAVGGVWIMQGPQYSPPSSDIAANIAAT